VQTEDKNILVHIGKNLDGAGLFLAQYRNGLRTGANTPLFEYEGRPVPMKLTIDVDYAVNLVVDDNIVYEGYIDAETIGRVLLFAWGDEHEYQVEFSQITLYSA